MLDVNLVAAIDEAAIIPENWPRVLEQLSNLVNGSAGAILAHGPSGDVRTSVTPSYEAPFEDWLAHGLQLENVRPQRALASRHAGFLTDLDLCTPEELARDPIYERFMRPYGLGWTTGTVIPVPTGDLIVFDLARRSDMPPFDRQTSETLDLYRPHLARAALMASRLGLQRARSRSETMALLGLPAAVLATGGRMIAANKLFEQLAPRVIFRSFGEVALANPSANHLLAEAIAAAEASHASHPRSVPMPAVDQSPALIAHLIPLRQAAHDIFATGVLMLVITEVTAPSAPLTELLTGLFDLTPAESRLARAVAGGQSLSDIASIGPASFETLRTQLKSVMAKTGTRRQVDLVRLLLGTAAPGRPPIEN